MTKKPLNLLVDEDLVKKARDHGLVLSRFLENQLRGYFDLIEGKSINYNPYFEKHLSKTHYSKTCKMGLWSSGYDVAFTRRRSPVQIRLSPYHPSGGFPFETKVKWQYLDFNVFSPTMFLWYLRTRLIQSYCACE